MNEKASPDAVLRQDIEARYAEICASIEASDGSNDKDLRSELADLAAMMIAYTARTGDMEAIEAALQGKGGASGERQSIAKRATALLAAMGKA